MLLPSSHVHFNQGIQLISTNNNRLVQGFGMEFDPLMLCMEEILFEWKNTLCVQQLSDED